MDFTTHALDYAKKLGWPVLLLGRGSKLPFIAKRDGGNGVLDATTDADQIRAWGRLGRHGNIGIACGDIVVLDIDPRHGGDVTIRTLAAKGHPFPKGPRQRTGNGGYHLVYRTRGPIKGGNNKLGPGIDVKAAGGYIVGAPSWTGPSESGPGGTYVWEVSPFDVEPPPLPAWVEVILNPPPRPRPSFEPHSGNGDVEPLARAVASAGTGNRNNCLFWAASRAAEMADRGLVSASSAAHRLLDAALSAGLDAREAKRTIDSAFGKAT